MAAGSQDTKHVGFRLPVEHLAWLERMAELNHSNRTQVLKVLLDAAIGTGVDITPIESNLRFERKVERLTAGA